VLHQIGNGASGPVFRAYDQDRDRLVAVKLFRLDLPPERVHQLVAEFEKLIAAELQHPVIAAPRATGIDNNNPYLAQDFAAAESLDVVLRENGAAPPAQAVRVAGQLAEALDYAADRQIVHGALHPRDILLSQEDIRIVGLGVARALERVGVTAPVRRPYAAPERINDGGWDRSADVFSLAAIAFEMLSGKRVTGTGSEAAEALGEVPGADTEALQRVFALALAADPAYRYSTATAFTDALKDAMGIEIAAPKAKAKRKPRLRVVSPELPLDEVPEVAQVPEVPDVPAVHEELLEVQAVQEPEELQELKEPEIEAPLVKKARRRRAPAPTPVAIETVAEPLALSEVEIAHDAEPELALSEVDGPRFEAIDEPVIQIEPEPVLAVEPVAELPKEFAPVEEPALEPIPDPQLFAEPEPDPEPAPVPAFLEPVNVEREPEPLNVEPEPEPLNVEPEPEPLNVEHLNAEPPVHDVRAASVWPIGVAAVLGIALGFAVGYMVAIRDKVVPPASAAAPVVAQPAAPAKEFTEVTALPAPAPVVAPPANAEKADIPSPKPKSSKLSSKKTPAAAPASAGTLIVESRPQGAFVLVDGRRVGRTPLKLSDVRAGRHAIRLERDGYRTWSARANVAAGEQNRVTASLEK
jgi:hypothetical protein